MQAELQLLRPATSKEALRGAGTLLVVVGMFLGVMALTACGGSSSGAGSTPAPSVPTATSVPTASQTGQFIDDLVQGASYYTSTGSGGCTAGTPCTTDSTGTFKFAAGDAVTFTALGVKLGSATLAGNSSGSVTLVEPNTLTGESSPTGTKAVALATFLHMISTTTAQGIEVNTKIGSLASAVPNADATQINNFAALQTSIQQSSGVNVSVPATSAITSILTQTATLTPATLGFDGSVWRGTCDSGCGGATFTLAADGAVFGFTDSSELVSGTWGVNTAGSIALSLVGSGGGSASGTLPAGKTSCTSCLTLTQGSGGTTTLSLAEVSAGSSSGASSVAANAYAGLWYAALTPNAAGIAGGLGGTAGSVSGGAVLVAGVDGNVHGLTDGGNFFSGSWSLTNGQGSATVTVKFNSSSSTTGTVSFDLSQQIGTLSVGGTSYGTLAFSRTNGTSTSPYFVLHSSSGSTPSSTSLIPFALKLQVNWKNLGGSSSVGGGGYQESLALDAHVDDGSGNRLASTVKSEQTYILFGTANVSPTTDNIALSYPAGSGATYHVTFGGGGTTQTVPGGTTPYTCSIANGSGTVVDANQGNSAAYPTVTVTCN